jgi:hypothetical protein
LEHGTAHAPKGIRLFYTALVEEVRRLREEVGFNAPKGIRLFYTRLRYLAASHRGGNVGSFNAPKGIRLFYTQMEWQWSSSFRGGFNAPKRVRQTFWSVTLNVTDT